MFLNVRHHDIQELEPILILDTEIVLEKWNRLSHLQTGKLWQQISYSGRSSPILYHSTDRKKPIPKIGEFCPVIFEVETYGPEAAVTVAQERLDIFRSILNLSSILGRVTVRSEPKYLSSVLPTPIYGIFDHSGNLVTNYYTVEKYDYRKVSISEEQQVNVRRLLSIFDHPLKYPDTGYHILGIISLYQEALDISSQRSAYLAMWRVLESSVTFGGERVTQRDVIRRIATLIDINPLFRDTLALLAELRNDLVHSGKFLEKGDDALATLKLITDTCLMRLLSLAHDLPNVNELREYLQLAPRGASDLARKERVISFIQDRKRETL
jgi:hypothetical protein